MRNGLSCVTLSETTGREFAAILGFRIMPVLFLVP